MECFTSSRLRFQCVLRESFKKYQLPTRVRLAMVKRSGGTLNLNFLGYEIYYDSSFIIIENNGEVREMNVTSRSRNGLITDWN